MSCVIYISCRKLESLGKTQSGCCLIISSKNAYMPSNNRFSKNFEENGNNQTFQEIPTNQLLLFVHRNNVIFQMFGKTSGLTQLLSSTSNVLIIHDINL